MRVLFFSDVHLAEKAPMSRGPGYAEELDLEVFRHTVVEGQFCSNGDGTYFAAYRINQFPPGLVIATSSLL